MIHTSQWSTPPTPFSDGFKPLNLGLRVDCYTAVLLLVGHYFNVSVFLLHAWILSNKLVFFGKKELKRDNRFFFLFCHCFSIKRKALGGLESTESYFSLLLSFSLSVCLSSLSLFFISLASLCLSVSFSLSLFFSFSLFSLSRLSLSLSLFVSISSLFSLSLFFFSLCRLSLSLSRCLYLLTFSLTPHFFLSLSSFFLSVASFFFLSNFSLSLSLSLSLSI